MIADTLVCLCFIPSVALGLSRPFMDRLRLGPAETLVAGVGLSLVMAWAIAWAVFVSGLSLGWYWLLPALGLAGLLAGRRGMGRLLADASSRDLILGQLAVSGWCLGWLAFVRVYSGGAWMGDWYEHWERAFFFLRRWPASGRLFIGLYELPARPPLANVLAAAFMRTTRVDYPHYQIVMAALCSLAYLPVGLLAGRFGGPRASRLAAVILMLNPLFMENATFPWTKLPAVFFILSGLYFFLRVRDREATSARAAILCALLFGGAILTHYSAGPYVVVIGIAWVAMGPAWGWSRAYLRMTAASVGAGACVLAPWFIWSVSHYGWTGTFLSNTSVTALEHVHGNHLVDMALNLRDTLVPPQIRRFKGPLLVQSSPWGRVRDQAFVCYQLNLLLALGCVAWLATCREAWRSAGAAARHDRRFWIGSVTGFVLVSIAVFGDREHYGIGQICLQSVVLLGLGFLAARWEDLGRGWRIALVAGWLVDFCLGIALQFAAEDFAIDRWISPGSSLDAVARTYNPVAADNYTQKVNAHLGFLADVLPASSLTVLILLCLVFFWALIRAGRRSPRLA
jgi:hypothetical protein